MTSFDIALSVLFGVYFICLFVCLVGIIYSWLSNLLNPPPRMYGDDDVCPDRFEYVHRMFDWEEVLA